jgi:protein O-GlcNAc transferase
MTIKRARPFSCDSVHPHDHCSGRGAQLAPSAASPNEVLLPALEALRAGRYDSASVYASSVLREDPANPSAWKITGIARLRLGLDARAALDAACRFSPRDAECHHLLAQAREVSGDLAGAIVAEQSAVALDPGLIDAHNDLGRMLLVSGASTAAIRTLDAALRLDPTYVPALGNRADALRAAGRLAESLEAYRRLLSIAPALPEAHLRFALALRDSGDAASALDHACHALSLAPGYLEALQCAVELHKLAGTLSEALPLIDRALLSRPSTP